MNHRRFNKIVAEQQIRCRMQIAEAICREEFIPRNLSKRECRNAFRCINRIFQNFVVEGMLFTVSRSGDYAFFRHRGRFFPKLWKVRKRNKQ